MSFNNLRYDTCSYKPVLSESIGPGEYQSEDRQLIVKIVLPKIHKLFNKEVV